MVNNENYKMSNVSCQLSNVQIQKRRQIAANYDIYNNPVIEFPL
jgi:hypothetical protein